MEMLQLVVGRHERAKTRDADMETLQLVAGSHRGARGLEMRMSGSAIDGLPFADLSAQLSLPSRRLSGRFRDADQSGSEAPGGGDGRSGEMQRQPGAPASLVAVAEGDEEMKQMMEERLLVKREEAAEESKSDGITWGRVGEEVKRVGCIAAPMVVAALSQYLLQMISVMMVGHLGKLSLSSTAMAVSLASVSGFSLLLPQNMAYQNRHDSNYCALHAMAVITRNAKWALAAWPAPSSFNTLVLHEMSTESLTY
ncbi:hypothetical protein NL676_032037 [Syzygium grande]|nr:hypothetical protein NL676_032037 [Syzygium grande]